MSDLTQLILWVSFAATLMCAVGSIMGVRHRRKELKRTAPK